MARTSAPSHRNAEMPFQSPALKLPLKLIAVKSLSRAIARARAASSAPLERSKMPTAALPAATPARVFQAFPIMFVLKTLEGVYLLALNKAFSQSSRGTASTLALAPFGTFFRISSTFFRISSIFLIIFSMFSVLALAVPEPECKIFCTIKNPSEGILAITNNPSPFFDVTFEPADTQPGIGRTKVVDFSTGLTVVPGEEFVFSRLPESTDRVAIIRYDFPDNLATGKYTIFAASTFDRSEEH